MLINFTLLLLGLDETILLREKQLKELTFELNQLEETNNLYLQSKAAVKKVEGEINSIMKAIEAARWNLVHMRCGESGDGKESKEQTADEGEGKGKGNVHTNVMNEVAETSMKVEIAEIIRSKVDLEISKEMEEVSFQRICSKLEALRKKYKISAKNPADVVKAMAASQQSSAIKNQPSSSGGGGDGGDSDFDDDDDDDDDDDHPENGSGADSDTEEGQSKAELRRSATKKLKKKLKKQKMLIDLLRNQIVNLGHKPIAEIVTYQRAESNLQNALARLMDGDETASDDFDKWDEFVRNHPEYKAKQIRLKERFKRENLAVNKAALRMFRTLVPPGTLWGACVYVCVCVCVYVCAVP